MYLASPLDISPDVFPVIGWIDDGVIASLLIAEVGQLVTEQLKRKQQSAAVAEIETDDARAVTVETVTVG